MKPDELLSQAMALPPQDRAKLAQELLHSLDDGADDEEQIAAEWVPELVRRSQEVASGKVELIDWETVRSDALTRCRNQ